MIKCVPNLKSNKRKKLLKIVIKFVEIQSSSSSVKIHLIIVCHKGSWSSAFKAFSKLLFFLCMCMYFFYYIFFLRHCIAPKNYFVRLAVWRSSKPPKAWVHSGKWIAKDGWVGVDKMAVWWNDEHVNPEKRTSFLISQISLPNISDCGEMMIKRYSVCEWVFVFLCFSERKC